MKNIPFIAKNVDTIARPFADLGEYCGGDDPQFPFLIDGFIDMGSKRVAPLFKTAIDSSI